MWVHQHRKRTPTVEEFPPKPRVCTRCGARGYDVGWKYCASCKESVKVKYSYREWDRKRSPEAEERRRLRKEARRKWRWENEPGYKERVTARIKARQALKEKKRVPRRAEGLLLECTKCKAMLPRGWFRANGKGRKHGWCRICRKPSDSEHQARRRSAGAQKRTKWQVEELWRKQRGLCGICFGDLSLVSFHVDHVIPLSKGGQHVIHNLRLTHAKCNLQKGDRFG